MNTGNDGLEHQIDEHKVMILTYHEWECLWCRAWNGVTDDVSTGDTVKCATCHKLSRAEWPS